MFPFLEIFGRQIPFYGLWLVVGAASSILLLYFTAPQKGLLRDDALYGALYALIGGLIGAKLLYLFMALPTLIRYFAYFSGSFSALYALLAGGYVYYGGLLGGVFTLWLYSRQFKTPFLPYLDHAAVFLPLAHAFGRIGCFFAGCCYGIPYRGSCAVTFPPETFGLGGVALFPVQLLEALLNFLLFLGLFFAFRKGCKPGQAAAAYLLCYAPLRFSLEFLRYDGSRGSLWLFSTSQWISAAAFFSGLALLYVMKRRYTLSKQKDVL